MVEICTYVLFGWHNDLGLTNERHAEKQVNGETSSMITPHCLFISLRSKFEMGRFKKILVITKAFCERRPRTAAFFLRLRC